MNRSAGELDKRIRIERRSQDGDARDSHGQPVDPWVLVVECWAKVEPIRGREFFSAERVQSEVTTRFTIRNRAGILPTMRVVWRGNAFEVTDVIEPRAALDTLELMCIDGLRDGRD